MGSIPVRVTMEKDRHPFRWAPVFFHCASHKIEPTQNALRFEYGFETLLRRFRVGSLVGRSKFPYKNPEGSIPSGFLLSRVLICIKQGTRHGAKIKYG